jgi:hypothetical protein
MDGLDNGVRASVEARHKLTTYSLAGSWSNREASTVQIDDLGFSTVRGRVDTYWIEGGLARELNAQDTVSWLTRFTSTQFSSPKATDLVDMTTTADWIRRLDPLNDLTASLQFEWQRFDNATNTELFVWRPIAGVRSRLTKQLTFKGSAGAAITTTIQDPGSNPPLPLSTARPGTQLGWIADALLSYKLNMSEISLSAAQSIAPSALGDLQQRSSVALYVRQDINNVSSVSFTGAFSRIKAPPGANSLLIDQSTIDGNAADVYTASVAYDHRLARDWNGRLAYKFSHRTSENGTANANTVLLAVKHDVTIWHDQ